MIIKTEFLDLSTPTGVMRTHVYAPAAPAGDKTYPGLLLYPEIYQQTGPIERLSRQPGRLHAATVVAGANKLTEVLRRHHAMQQQQQQQHNA